MAFVELYTSPELFKSIVGGFLGDDNVVDVALTQSRRRDAHKASFALQFVDGPAPAVAHSGAQAPDQLGDHVGERALVGDAAFDALGDQFRNLAFLRVAVSRSRAHGGDGAHAAVGLEARSEERRVGKGGSVGW